MMMNHLKLISILRFSLLFFESTTTALTRQGPYVGGGVKADIKKFPWQVFIVMKTPTANRFCASFLISSCYAMTAAHCMVDEDVLYHIIFAADDIKDWKGLNETHVTTSASNVFKHPEYDADQAKNDIALVLFKDRIELNEFLRPIKLPFDDIEDLENYPATFAGYGADESGKLTLVLFSVKLTILPGNECKTLLEIFDEKTQICTKGEEGKGPCFGDSGGALIIRQNERKRAVGVISYVVEGKEGRCFTEEPAIFTRIHSFMPWVEEVTRTNTV